MPRPGCSHPAGQDSARTSASPNAASCTAGTLRRSSSTVPSAIRAHDRWLAHPQPRFGTPPDRPASEGRRRNPRRGERSTAHARRARRHGDRECRAPAAEGDRLGPGATIAATGAVSMASTGTDRDRASPDRGTSASVASSAASVSLSTRRARASGLLRSRRNRRLGSPAMIPACGPPSSLSPLMNTSDAPARIASRAVGSPASP